MSNRILTITHHELNCQYRVKALRLCRTEILDEHLLQVLWQKIVQWTKEHSIERANFCMEAVDMSVEFLTRDDDKEAKN